MAAARTTEVFSAADAAWWYMNKPANLMMVTGVFMFDEPIDFERYKATVEYRMACVPRFRQRLRKPLLPIGLPSWETDPGFDINCHVHRIALPAPGDESALQELVGDLMSTPLDYTKPLWQIHLVEGYGSGCAVVTRLAHCIADGVALMHLLLDMADDSPDAPWPAPPDHHHRRPAPLVETLSNALVAVDNTVRFSENLLHEGMETLVHPSRLLGTALTGASVGVAASLALGKLLLLPPDNKTLFKGQCRVAKRAAWSTPIDLADVKALGKVVGGTVNDLLLSAMTGALRRYLITHGDEVEGLDIRAVVPVNLRPRHDHSRVGNRFGLIFLDLPVGVADPMERMRVLKRRMDAIKATPEAVVAFGILNVMGLSQQQIADVICAIFGSKGTAVMTNVPGPRHELYMAGKRLRNVMFWVPQAAQLGMGVSILSYAGQVTVGVATDEGLVPDPQTIARDFEREFRHMQELARAGAQAPIAPMVAEPCADEPAAAVAHPLAEALAGSTGDGEPARCQSLTRAGEPCRNRALPGQTTCFVHSRVPAPSPG